MLLQRGARGGGQPCEGCGSRARLLQAWSTAHTLQHLHNANAHVQSQYHGAASPSECTVHYKRAVDAEQQVSTARHTINTIPACSCLNTQCALRAGCGMCAVTGCLPLRT